MAAVHRRLICTLNTTLGRGRHLLNIHSSVQINIALSFFSFVVGGGLYHVSVESGEPIMTGVHALGEVVAVACVEVLWATKANIRNVYVFFIYGGVLRQHLISTQIITFFVYKLMLAAYINMNIMLSNI